jgi:1-phosphofructokinase family hexose kinase
VAGILSVTLNPALDEAVSLDTLVLGDRNRCSLDSLDPGGKGLNASRVIHRLGRETLATGFAGGVTGAWLREKLDAERVPHAFYEVEEPTRINIMIYERDTGRRSRMYLPGAHVTEEGLAQLTSRLAAVPSGGVVIIGGSIPPGLPPTVYRDVIRLLRQRAVQTILDTSGAPFLAALAAAPALVKPNVEEAAELLGRPLRCDGDVLAAAHELRSMGAERVVISQGAEGAIGVDAGGAWKAVPPRVEARSTVGSGDSMVAGFAIALNEGGSLAEGLRLGTATGAATAMVPGTRLCQAQDVAALLEEVKISRLAAAA